MWRLWKEAAFWLVPHGLLSLLSYRTQDRQPRDGTTHSGLGPSPSITKKENALQVCLLPHCIFSTEVPFSLMILVCVK